MRFLLTLVGCFCAVLTMWGAKFLDVSPLANSHNVKVMTIAERRQYATYATLRKHGFENPSEVKVYGYGNGCQPMSCGQPGCYSDTLRRVVSFHRNDTLYFDGRTPEDLKRNPYSDYGWFLLSDRADRNAATAEQVEALKRIDERYSPISYMNVEDAGLHQLGARKDRLLIIAPPKFLNIADSLASAHKRYNGLGVSVVTPEQIYNEFSCGSPDPSAIRAFVKNTYETGDGALRSLILLGQPIRDLKLFAPATEVYNYHIGLLEEFYSEETIPALATDVYGKIDDAIDMRRIHFVSQKVAVGLLPIRTQAEGERMVRKVNRWLSFDRWEEILGTVASVGGVGNQHVNSRSAQMYADYMNEAADGSLCSKLLITDALGSAAKGEFLKMIREGALMTSYFGHGTMYMLDGDAKFFSIGDVSSLKSKALGLGCLYCCEALAPEEGVRGLGEALVLDAEEGFGAVIASTRQTFASENEYLAKNFGWYLMKNKVGSNVRHTATQTLGEFYCKSRNYNSIHNYVNYLLIGDPELPLVTPTRMCDVEVDAQPAVAGAVFGVKGSVCNFDRTVDTEFTGRGKLRLLAPRYEETSRDYISNYEGHPFHYDSKILMETEVECENGRFEGEVVLPSGVSVGDYTLQFSFYDKKRVLGAANRTVLRLRVPEAEEMAVIKIDKQSPTVAATYRSDIDEIELRMFDDMALPENKELERIVEVKIDGVKHPVRILQREENREAQMMLNAKALAKGKHTVDVWYGDAAGNLAVEKLSIDKTDRKPMLSLSAGMRVATEQQTFSVSVPTNMSVRLVVTNLQGATVATETYECTDKNAEIILNSSGLVLGLYRAYIEEVRGDEVPARYSNSVVFGVVNKDI